MKKLKNLPAVIAKTSEEKAHAEFGASSSERWLNCPGSVLLSRGMENFESEYAREGTEAHACFELLLKNRKNPAAARKLALTKYDSEMIQHCEAAVDFVVGLLAAFVGKTSLYIETKVNASKFTCEGQFGTLDVGIAAHTQRVLTIADFKYGAGIAVEPDGGNGKGNSQLAYYALGMLLKLGPKNFDRVDLWVIQPRADHESGNTERLWSCSTSELLEWGKVFKRGVKVALGPNAPLKYGDKWCRFCPAKTKCPVIKDEAFKQAQIDFSPKTNEIKKLPNIDKVKDFGPMLDACEKLQVFINAVQEAAYQAASAGRKVTGFKLVEKRTTRKWKNADKAQAQALKVLGEAALTERKLLSPAQIEKKFKKSKAVKKWVERNVTTSTGGTTLARVESEKKEVKAFSDFTEVEG